MITRINLKSATNEKKHLYLHFKTIWFIVVLTLHHCLYCLQFHHTNLLSQWLHHIFLTTLIERFLLLSPVCLFLHKPVLWLRRPRDWIQNQTAYSGKFDEVKCDIHPFSDPLNRGRAALELIPAQSGQEAGYTQRRTLVYNTVHTQGGIHTTPGW